MQGESHGSAQWRLSVTGDPPIVLVVLAGRFDAGSWVRAIQAVPSTPGFRPGLNSIIDAREAHLDFSMQEVRDLVGRLEGHVERRGGGGFKSAVVVPDTLSFGLSRMIQTLADDGLVESGVFKTLEEAKAWLAESKS